MNDLLESGRRFVSVAEVARYLGVSKMTVYRLVHASELASVRVGRGFRIPLVSLHRFIAQGGNDLDSPAVRAYFGIK